MSARERTSFDGHQLRVDFSDSAISEEFHSLCTLQIAEDAAVCGKQFSSADIIYRCNDCAADETCCYCQSCFQAGDHANHGVYFVRSDGQGGCCDCGDQESWKVAAAPCAHRGSLQAVAVSDRLREELAGGFPIRGFLEKIAGATLAGIGGSKDDAVAVTLYRKDSEDEAALPALLQLTGAFSDEQIQGLLSVVEKRGQVLIASGSADVCSLAFNFFKARGYDSVQMTSMAYHTQSEYAIMALRLLRRLSRISFIRELICRELFEQRASSGTDSDWIDDEDAAQSRCPIEFISLREQFLCPALRSEWSRFVISCVFGDSERPWKLRFSLFFAREYESFLRYLSQDPEPELNILSLSVQIFTGRLISQRLAEEACFLETLSRLLLSHHTTQAVASSIAHRQALFERGHPAGGLPDFQSFEQLTNDTEFILAHAGVEVPTAVLQQLCEFFSRFDGLAECVRKEGDHIEWADEETGPAFTVVRRLLPLVPHVAKLMQVENAEFLIEKLQCQEAVHSFHHPSLWLLGCYLRAHCDFDAPKESLLNILLLLMGKEAFYAEVAAGLWVRNGASLKLQWRIYRTLMYSDVVPVSETSLARFCIAKASGGFSDQIVAAMLRFFFADGDLESNPSIASIFLVYLGRLLVEADCCGDFLVHALALGSCSPEELELYLPEGVDIFSPEWQSRLASFTTHEGNKFSIGRSHLPKVNFFNLLFPTNKERSAARKFLLETFSFDLLFDAKLSVPKEFSSFLRSLERQFFGRVSLDALARGNFEAFCCLTHSVRSSAYSEFLSEYKARATLDLTAGQRKLWERAFGVACESAETKISPVPPLGSARREAILREFQLVQQKYLAEETRQPDQSKDCCMICKEELDAERCFGNWANIERMCIPAKYYSAEPTQRTTHLITSCGHQLHFGCCALLLEAQPPDDDFFCPPDTKCWGGSISQCPVCFVPGNCFIPTGGKFNEKELGPLFTFQQGFYKTWSNLFFDFCFQFQQQELFQRSTSKEYQFAGVPSRMLPQGVLSSLLGVLRKFSLLADDSQAVYEAVQKKGCEFYLAVLDFIQSGTIADSATPIVSTQLRFLGKIFNPSFASESGVSTDRLTGSLPSFRLIPLPGRLDLLVAESLRKSCSHCANKPGGYLICLACGCLLYREDVCCSVAVDGDGRVEEVNAHRFSCIFETLVLVAPIECAVFVAYNCRSIEQPLPYTDRNGFQCSSVRRRDRKPLLNFDERCYQNLLIALLSGKLSADAWRYSNPA